MKVYLCWTAIGASAKEIVNEDLIEASKNGDLIAIEEILRMRPSSLNRQNSKGETPLHWAAMVGEEVYSRFECLTLSKWLRRMEGTLRSMLSLNVGRTLVLGITPSAPHLCIGPYGKRIVSEGSCSTRA